MALYVIATPIGDIGDLSVRAREILARVDLVIGEEAKPTRRLLSAAGLSQKPIELLNEHSGVDDIAALSRMCVDQEVALVSDCGTPGFCDPGAELVAACRQSKVAVISVAGPSSLMSFISVLGVRISSFVFWGFLPLDKILRSQSLRALALEKRGVFLIETPYRFRRLLEELSVAVGARSLIVGLNLSCPDEMVVRGRASEILAMDLPPKPEFLIYLEGV